MRNYFAGPAVAAAVAAAVATALAASPAAAQGIKLLAHHTNLSAGPLSANSALVQVQIGPFPTEALVLVSAQGGARTAPGGGPNRGITVDIVDGTLVLRDDSFEAQASNMVFRAAVSPSFLLPVGTVRTVTARTLPYGAGASTNTDAKISMDLAAIAVGP